MAGRPLDYTVETRYPSFEVRSYSPCVVAETEVHESQAEATVVKFRHLAGDLFEKNHGGNTIALTALALGLDFTGITKAAPTTAVHSSGSADRYTVQLLLPSKCTITKLPLALDDRIRFRQIPARRLAAIRYTGTWSTRLYLHHLERLRAATAREQLEPAGEPIWARYDAPFWLWFLRRNEVLLEL